ncbi:MAG: hypothetical protein JXR84_26175 [Anaerolineae bacterium]|nr:hypothetical protein [Anaerolineae bacterium]
METRKNLLQVLGDWWATRRISAMDEAVPSRRALNWLGRQLLSSIVPVVLVLILLTTFPGLAASNSAPMGTSLSTIPYQGRLADASGNPITDRQNMEFRLYDTPVGGTPLWEEFWTGGNSVNVSDGLFSVMLGSINTALASVVQGNDQLYLGITVGTDTEMAPRVQLGSVPFSMISLTVPDGSITGEKIATGAITTTHLLDGSVTGNQLADGAVTSAHLNPTVRKVLATNNVSLTTTGQTAASAIITVDVPSRVWLLATCDFHTSGGSLAAGGIAVDDQALTGSIFSGWNTASAIRHTVSNSYVFDLAPGSHTVELVVSLGPGGGDGAAYAWHTGFSYFVTGR